AGALDELAAEFLSKDTLGQPRSLLLDQLRVQVGIGPRRQIPGLVVFIVALSASEHFKEPPPPLGGRDHQRPATLVDQPLAEVALPDHRLEPRRLVDDEPVETLAEERDGIVGGLATDLADSAGHVAHDEALVALLQAHDAVA